VTDLIGEPLAIIDGDGQVLFVHDCLALCGDGVTRLIPARNYVLSIPPWSMDADAPLTLSPSILCEACQLHGHFRAGVWEPC
jgi:Family of unknown function (DUF6527)